MVGSPAILFSPSPEQLDRLVDDLTSPDLNLREIALQHGTTMEGLSLWMTSPEARERLGRIQGACAFRARFSATALLPAVVDVLRSILSEHAGEEAHIHADRNSFASLEQRRRGRETARKAAAMLLRIARFDPDKPTPRSRPTRTGGTGCQDGRPAPSPSPRRPADSFSIDDVLDLLNVVRSGATAPTIPGSAPAPAPATAHGHGPAPAPPNAGHPPLPRTTTPAQARRGARPSSLAASAGAPTPLSSTPRAPPRAA